ncbi:MAG: aminopeptidase P family protein [Firmicutes bacterium]|nr:aminopeptidase P family protein [Bacillota bacterium]
MVCRNSISNEFRQRWVKLKEKMITRGLDLLFIYSNDRAVFGPGNIRYLSNFPVHFEHAAIIMPRFGEPILAVGPETREYAELSSEVKDIRVIKEFAIPDEEYPYTSMTSLSAILEEIRSNSGNEVRSIGLIGLDLLPWSLYQVLENTLLSNRRVENAEDILIDMRSIKSQYEIEIIEEGYAIADKAMEACVEAVHVGTTELAIAAAGEAVMRKLGAEGYAIDTIVASGKQRTYPIVVRPSDRKIEKGDVVLITMGPRYKGYNPAIGRPVIVGDAPEVIIEAMQLALKAQHAAEAALRPGAIGCDVEGMARKVLAEAGLEQYFVYAGVHSVGLAEFEPPILSPKSNLQVKENMVLSIDIPLFLTPWGGFRYEDGFVVTSDGCRRLNHFPREIIKV